MVKIEQIDFVNWQDLEDAINSYYPALTFLQIIKITKRRDDSRVAIVVFNI